MSDLSIPDPNAPRYPQALDIQHDTDPAQDHGDARRIPHLGHAALFFGIAIASFFVSVIGAFVIYIALHPHASLFGDTASLTPAVIHLAAAAQLIGYALTFAICFPVFQLIWRRSFLDGIHWTWRAARLRWWKLILLGVGLSLAADLAEHLFKAPKQTTSLERLSLLSLKKLPSAGFFCLPSPPPMTGSLSSALPPLTTAGVKPQHTPCPHWSWPPSSPAPPSLPCTEARSMVHMAPSSSSSASRSRSLLCAFASNPWLPRH
jgi:hypothetical protein